MRILDLAPPVSDAPADLNSLVRDHDWSSSPIGPAADWPASLRSIVSLMLNSKFPMFLAWGEQLTFLYNDAYAPILGAKHPLALGVPFQHVWAEIWDDLRPLAERALAGEATWLEDMPLVMNRHGYDEETWFTFSYSPALDDTGTVAGIFCACTETTEKVLAVRRTAAERHRLAQLFGEAPAFMALVTGPEHVFELANDSYMQLVGHRDIVGKKVREALPEVDGQGFFELLDRVYSSGEPFRGFELPLYVHRVRGGAPELAYVNFVYQPIRDGTGAVTGIFVTGYDVTELCGAKDRLETLNKTGTALAADLDLDRIVQRVTDAGVALTQAQFGAFFYNTPDENGESLTLYKISGARAEDFSGYPHPRATQVFRPTFDGECNVLSDDITADPRYGKNSPYYGLPEGHLPVRSYLAVPVKSRTGEVIGGLFFGHEEPARFTKGHEDLISGIASQAAVAVDNARLYREAQAEIHQRKRAEEHQRLLINELNHRVKNTLAIVQSLAQQSFKGDAPADVARKAFDDRLGALSAAHSLLTRENWVTASLAQTVETSVAATAGANARRVELKGPDILLAPQTAVSVAMAMHELCTNAIKYGALSNAEGRVRISWRILQPDDSQRLCLEWREEGGPPVQPPKRRGFGSRMIERGLSSELRGKVQLEFAPEGLICTIDAPLPEAGS